MLDDPGNGVEFACQTVGIGNSTEGYVDNMVAAVGEERATVAGAQRPCAPARPILAMARSTAIRVAAAPNDTISTGRGKAPRVSTSFAASAMTIMRLAAVAMIFSRSSAPPPPLISRSWPSISSAPSTTRSSAGCSSRVASGMPSGARERGGALRGRHADDRQPGADALAEQADEVLRRAAAAEAELHARLDIVERGGGGAPPQLVAGGQRVQHHRSSPPISMYLISTNSSMP